MKKLLHIECSPRKQRSASKRLAEKFIETYLLRHSGDQIETIDLWNMDMPEYDEITAEAKYKMFAGEKMTDKERNRWQALETLFNQFKSADKYLFSIPMWNFSIPYKLKHYIDLITQPRLAFAVTPDRGYKGLLTGKPVVLIYSRGGEYKTPPLRFYDQQSPYMDLWLRFIGFDDITTVEVEPMLGPQEARVHAMENALELIIAKAVKF